MAGGYNFQRESLTNQHINGMRQLGGLYTRSIEGLYLGLAKEGTSGLISAFSSLLPEASRPFQMSAAQLGFQFFNMRRDMAAENASGRVPPNRLTLESFDIDSIARAAMSGKLADIGFMLSKGLSEGRDVKELLPAVTQSASKLVTDVNRETVKQASDADEFSGTWVVAVSPNGCNFCKSMTLDWGADEDTLNFHKKCSCVVDASFKEEIKFRQSFHDDFHKDVEEARALIESGEAGERRVQAGSPEWETKTRKELAQAARAYRKDVEERNNIPKDERAAYREIMNKRVEDMLTKSRLAAQGKYTLTEQDNKQLGNWGIDSKEILKPRSIPVDSFTQKNINVALEIVQGKRQVQE